MSSEKAGIILLADEPATELEAWNSSQPIHMAVSVTHQKIKCYKLGLGTFFSFSQTKKTDSVLLTVESFFGNMENRKG